MRIIGAVRLNVDLHPFLGVNGPGGYSPDRTNAPGKHTGLAFDLTRPGRLGSFLRPRQPVWRLSGAKPQAEGLGKNLRKESLAGSL